MLPQKGPGESSGPILWEESKSLRLQEQCRQVMCQLDAFTVAPSPVNTLPSKPKAREVEWEPSVVVVPTPSMPMSPNFLQLAMDQCKMRLNEQGELAPTNTESLHSLLPTTHGFWGCRTCQQVWLQEWPRSSTMF